MILKGLARHLGKEVKQKVGLTTAQFLQMYKLVDFSVLNNISLWAAMILCFRSLLRKSNVVPDNPKALDMVLRRCDVEVTPQGVTLLVRKSKTIQYSERTHKIPIHFTTSGCFCAASKLLSHLTRFKGLPQDPIFYMTTTSGKRPMVYKDLLTFVKSCVQLIGLDPKDVGLHSMRRSGAMYLHESGVPLVDIMYIGDWKSLAALTYLCTPFQRKVSIEASVASHLSSLF